MVWQEFTIKKKSKQPEALVPYFKDLNALITTSGANFALKTIEINGE